MRTTPQDEPPKLSGLQHWQPRSHVEEVVLEGPDQARFGYAVYATATTVLDS